MIDVYTNGVQLTVEKIKQLAATPVGVFLYAFVTGAVGIVILLAFLSLFVSTAALPMVLPALIAFNCAAGGYSIVSKEEVNKPLPKISLFCIALFLTITGCIAILFFCPWESLVNVNRYIICGSAALIFTFFGAWIASKNNHLNKS